MYTLVWASTVAHRRQHFGSLRAFFMSVCAAWSCLHRIVDVDFHGIQYTANSVYAVHVYVHVYAKLYVG